MAKFWPLCIACALAGCAGNGDGLDENGRPLDEGGGDGGGSGALQPTFQSIQEHVFTPICTACHAGASAPQGLRLDAGSSYALLVNAASAENPSLLRVNPNNPDASYLIQKLEGTAPGGRMPLGGTPLPAETIAVIRQWITNGATNDAATGVSAKPRLDSELNVAQLTAVAPMSGEAMPASTREIVITSNVELDTSLLQSGLVTLRASGGDGNFDSGNESVVPVTVAVRSQQPTVLAITPQMARLPVDTYELRISGSDPVALADFDARAIDGDDNGTPGGDFVLRFTVEMMR